MTPQGDPPPPAGGSPAGSLTGAAMHDLARELYPICRSITGEGVRRTLAIVRRHLPLELHEVPSGTPVFDWTVPKEWNIRDAFIKDLSGRRVVDFRESNLHVVGYSMPVQGRYPLAELRRHLFSLPERPDWIPYRTSYYAETWGFCVSHRQLEAMSDAEYEVGIDSTLADGHLTYGELVLPGDSMDEVLFSCHVCHPSLCNDNLSGIAVTTGLAAWIASLPRRRYTYRFLFLPGTIGSITWLARNEARATRIKHGLVITCVGDRGPFTYKKSRRGDAEIDRAVRHVLQMSGDPHTVQDFLPYGYDERQYCSPGFDLPVGCLMRTPHGKFPEYHTSADNLDFIRPEKLAESLDCCRQIVEVLEHNRVYRSLNPKCEPQLGRRGLYAAIGGDKDVAARQLAMLWVLNLADGQHSLLRMAERSGVAFPVVRAIAELLKEKDLLVEGPGPATADETRPSQP